MSPRCSAPPEAPRHTNKARSHRSRSCRPCSWPMPRSPPSPWSERDSLHGLLIQQRACPTRTAPALADLKLFPQTRPSPCGGGSPREGTQPGKQAEAPLSHVALGRGFVSPPRDPAAQESHACASANPASKATAGNSKPISSTGWVISAFNCLDDFLQEGGRKKNQTHFALKDPAL